MTDEMRSKLKQLEISAKRLVSSSLPGDYQSAFKGMGLEFDQIREYDQGDDVRTIDWNATAKMNKLMVKKFVQERDRTIIIAVDISASQNYGSTDQLKQDLAHHVASSIAFVGVTSKDRVGLLLFSDVVEQWIAPARGNSQFGRILEALCSAQSDGKKTDLEQALKFLIGLKNRRGVVLFVISDWMEAAENYKQALRVAACEYDLIAVSIADRCEQQLPACGYLYVKDPESGQVVLIDTRDAQLTKFLGQTMYDRKRLFEQCKVDHLALTAGQPFVVPMIRFFHERTRRQV